MKKNIIETKQALENAFTEKEAQKLKLESTYKLLDKTDDSLLIFENLSQSISSEVKLIINNFSNIVLIEEAFEHCGIYSRLSKVVENKQTLSHFFIGNEIANTKISRNKAKEKYLFCGI